MRRLHFSAVTLAALLAGAALPNGAARAGDSLSGRPVVVDGDTLRLRGRIVGLSGIAAPGLDQVCEGRTGTVPCGRQAARALADHIGGAAVTCTTSGFDRSRRLLATCRLGDEDLNGWMVSSGLAVSERFSDRTYFAHETAAWAKRRGLWSGVFEDPTGRQRGDYASAADAAASRADPPGPEQADGDGTLRVSRLAK